MKKAIIFIAYVAFVTLIFSGCNCDLIGSNEFVLFDTVTIKMDQTLYSDNNLWVRLDSITRDTRCPEGYQCYIQGGAEAKFTVGYRDTSISFKVSTDSLLYKTFDHLNNSLSTLIFGIISVEPERQSLDHVISQRRYKVDFVLEEGMMVYKPNIYLYPRKKCKLDVSLDFPQGGEVVKSIPDYPGEWKNIKVQPSGVINNFYNYLFYEAALPDKWQVDEGWSVKTDDLEIFFRENMIEYGFNAKEINDFILYWIPRLKNHPCYNIYPQYTEKVDELVTLNISIEPESIMRMFYVIEGSDEISYIPAPGIPEFNAEGFVAREWGVILK